VQSGGLTVGTSGVSGYAEDLKEVTAQLSEVEVLSKRIENLQIHDTNASLAMQQESYNEQLRLSTRGLGDALGIAGKLAGTTKNIVDYTAEGAAVWDTQTTAATEYGQLQRAQIMDSRQLSQIQLARSQRELNLSIAISRLRAPGETAAERSVRRQEAEMIAKESQRELDINKRTTLRGFTIQDIELSRTAQDTMKQFELMTGQRSLTIELQGSQAVQQYLTRTKSLKEELLNIPLTMADSLVKGVEQAWTQFETDSGEFKDAFGAEALAMFSTIAGAARKKFKIEDIVGDWSGTITIKPKSEMGSVGGSATSGYDPNATIGGGGGAGASYDPNGTVAGGGGSTATQNAAIKKAIEDAIKTRTLVGDNPSRAAMVEYLKSKGFLPEQFNPIIRGDTTRREVGPDGRWTKPEETTTRPRREVGPDGRWLPRQAAGGIFSPSSATSFIAGESGPETVIVIRNPKLGMTSGGSTDSGKGGGSVTININASVRDDRDVDALVRQVTRELHKQALLVA
jgi:hypothetical protein